MTVVFCALHVIFLSFSLKQHCGQHRNLQVLFHVFFQLDCVIRWQQYLLLSRQSACAAAFFSYKPNYETIPIPTDCIQFQGIRRSLCAQQHLNVPLQDCFHQPRVDLSAHPRQNLVEMRRTKIHAMRIASKKVHITLFEQFTPRIPMEKPILRQQHIEIHLQQSAVISQLRQPFAIVPQALIPLIMRDNRIIPA